MTIQAILDLGQYGVVGDAAPLELPPNAWTRVQNIRFKDGYAQRAGGHSQVFTTPSITPYSIAPFVTATARYWVHIGLTAAYVDDGAARTNISRVTPYTGAVDDRWMCSSFNGVFIANNGVDLPQYWGGDVSVKLQNLTAWNANWRAAVIRPFKNYLVALDITKSGIRYGSTVKWSTPADPGTLPASWDEANPVVEAGEQPLAETADLLVDAMPLGDVLVIYKERSMYAMQPSGDIFVFRFTRLPGDYGMLTRGCGAVTPVGHVVMSAGDLILHNGGQPKSLLSGRMREWFASTLDQTNWRRSFVVANSNTSEVWACFPRNGDTACTQAMVWNWESDTFGLRDLPNVTDADFGVAVFGVDSFDSDSASFDSDPSPFDQMQFAATRANLVMATTAPLVIATEQANDFAGAAFTAILERKHIALGGDTDTVKLVRSIRPRIIAAPGTVLTIEVGSSMDVEVEPTYSAPVTYTVGSTLKADCFVSGRFHSIRITSTGTAPWRIKSMDVDYVIQGRY